MKITKYFGGPGTGKTRTLISKVAEELDNGLKIEDIGYLGFTRASAFEALSRASKKFNLEKKKRYWFRTIHATCLFLLRKKRYYQKVVNSKHLKAFCYRHGLEYRFEDEDSVLGDRIHSGNAFFNIYGYIINTLKKPEEWKNVPNANDFPHEMDFPYLYDKWELYKRKNDLIDFNDMLTIVMHEEFWLPTEVLFVDEFQDLSPLQYLVIDKFMRDKERVYIAGDDDQAIYRFQGANPEILLDFKCDSIHVLPTSYRLPTSVWEISNRLISKNADRQEKDITPRKEKGTVRFLFSPMIDDLINEIEGRTFILFRTNYHLMKFSWRLMRHGILYRFLSSRQDKILGWSKTKLKLYHKLLSSLDYESYLWDLERRGKLSRGVSLMLMRYLSSYRRPIYPEKINTFIGTIHSAKGKEADTVILFDDITSRVLKSMRTAEGLADERRVFYVGLTRARQKLVIVHDYFGGESFDLPRRLEEGSE